MNDWGLSVLNQFPVDVVRTRRGRGSLIVETNQGLKVLVEYTGTKNHLEVEQKLLEHLKKNWSMGVDAYNETVKGELLAVSEEGVSYVLKDWFGYPECNVNDEQKVVQAVELLASLHKQLRFLDSELVEPNTNHEEDSLLTCFLKHNREMKRVRSFVRKKHSKTDFELCILDSFDCMYNQAGEATEWLSSSSYQKMYLDVVSQRIFCHGNYHQHNALLGDTSSAVINFSNAGLQLQIVDLYHFMRKVLEKHEWNILLGKKMLDAYHRLLPVSREEFLVLRALFAYPEKYWKQLNFYYNGNKVWIPQRNIDKLMSASLQYQNRENFVITALKM